MVRLLRWGALAFAYLVGAIAALWAIGALFFDLPWASLHGVASIILAFAFVSALIFLRGVRKWIDRRQSYRGWQKWRR